MEDEKGDVGLGGGGGVVSLQPLSGKLVGESFVESMGGENHVEESYEQGYGGEIMVEIVGPDVFVGGVSGKKEGYVLGSDELGNFEDHAWDNGEENEIQNFSEAMDVWDEGEVNNLGGIEVGFLDSKAEFSFVVREETDVGFSESVDPEKSEEVVETTPVLTDEEKSMEDVVEEEVGTLEKEEVLSDVAQVPFSEASVNPNSEVSHIARVCGIDSSANGTDGGAVFATNSPKYGVVKSKFVDENEVVAGESSDSILKMDSFVSDAQDESRNNGEQNTSHAIAESSYVVEFKAKASDIILPDGSIVSNDGLLKNGRDLETDTEENQQTTRASRCPEETEIVQTDSVMFDDPIVKSEAGLGIVVEDYELPQSKEQLFEVQITDVSCKNGVDKLAGIDTMPNEPHVSIDNVSLLDTGDMVNNPENEGTFAISDLVWGKVRNHPWWPGQVFGPEDASDKAVKYYRKDSYLVAYFGDRTFSWSDASVLRPFRSYFPQIEKQNNSEAFQNAVDSALGEVSRRVELGLSCSCTAKDAYRRIEAQLVESTGIREESRRRYGVDHSSRAAFFEPNKLLEYVRTLATRPSRGTDRVDLVILRAQLSAFCRFKGHRLPNEFPSSEDLLESDEKISDEAVVSNKGKDTPKDDSCSRKERSLTELMGDVPKKLSSGSKKRKAVDPLTDGSGKRVNGSTSQTHKPSFRIGECISKVASQLKGSTSSVKDEIVIDGPQESLLAESISVNEILLQLQMVAQNPDKENSFQNSIRTFFSGFRSYIALNRRGKKRKAESAIGGSGEKFKFDDVNDSYWTDRIVHNNSEEQTLPYSETGLMPFVAEKPVKKSGRKSHSRKRISGGTHPTAAMESDENVQRRKQESSPAELILTFAERKCIPSEINLNKVFRRFGPLMESETEVDHDFGRAKVIFKRGIDAVVAHDSADKFKIFGSVIVNYEIGYSPLISVKILPLEMPQFPDEEDLML